MGESKPTRGKRTKRAPSRRRAPPAAVPELVEETVPAEESEAALPVQSDAAAAADGDAGSAAQTEAVLRAGQELAARVDEVVTRWEQSLAAGEATLAGSISNWQATLAGAEEALGTLQATIARGRDSLVAWQATVARGESSVDKAEAQLTHTLNSLGAIQADLRRQHEEFTEELSLGRETAARWQGAFKAGSEWVEEWRQSTEKWQRSLVGWTESSNRILSQWSALLEAETAKRAQRRGSPVFMTLFLIVLLGAALVAGYMAADRLAGLREPRGGTVAAPRTRQTQVPAPPSVGAPLSPAAAPAAATDPPPAQAMPAPPAVLYHIQVGAFRRKENAEGLVRQLAELGFKAEIRQQDALHKVYVGAYTDRAQADASVVVLRGQGYRDAFVSEEAARPSP